MEFNELRQEYVLQFPEKALQLRQAVGLGDWNELHRLAHRIAGSGTLYGFPELSEKAREICESIQDDEQNRVPAMVAELESMLAERSRSDCPSDLR